MGPVSNPPLSTAVAPTQTRSSEPPAIQVTPAAEPALQPPLPSAVKQANKAPGVALPAPSVGVLKSVSGDVMVRPPNGAFRKAVEGERIGANWQVASYDGGKVVVQFKDKSEVSLDGNGLLVVYAGAEKSRVSKIPPPRVELDEAEVKRGLAALRGES